MTNRVEFENNKYDIVTAVYVCVYNDKKRLTVQHPART